MRNKWRVGFCMMAGLIWLALSGATGYGFPGWMGVYGSYSYYMGSNPGTFTVLLNQDYYGLNCYVYVCDDNGNYQLYSMVYGGDVSGNSIWTFSPSTIFPPNSTISFYFEAWETYSSSTKYLGSAGSPLTATASAAGAPTYYDSSLELAGNNVSFGDQDYYWPNPGMLFSFYDTGTASVGSYLYSTAYQAKNTWVWEHPQYSGSSNQEVEAMVLDSSHRLNLFNPANPTSTTPVIVLDPTVPQITVNGQPISTLGGSPGSLVVGVGDNAGTQDLAEGQGVTASGTDSSGFGYGTTAEGYAQVAMGRYNVDQSENGAAPVSGSWVGTDPLFELGDGQTAASPSDAVVVYKNGDAVFSGTSVTFQGVVTVQPGGDIPMFTGQ